MNISVRNTRVESNLQVTRGPSAKYYCTAPRCRVGTAQHWHRLLTVWGSAESGRAGTRTWSPAASMTSVQPLLQTLGWRAGNGDPFFECTFPLQQTKLLVKKRRGMRRGETSTWLNSRTGRPLLERAAHLDEGGPAPGIVHDLLGLYEVSCVAFRVNSSIEKKKHWLDILDIRNTRY